MTSFQDDVVRTLKPGTDRQHLITAALGLIGEAGEIADEIKKAQDQDRPVNPSKIIEEGGDFLYYVAVACHKFKMQFAHYYPETMRIGSVDIMAVKLGVEAGRLADVLLTTARFGIHETINLEVGQVCMTLGSLLNSLEIDPLYVLEFNIAKRARRYAAGFSAAASRERVDARG